MSITRRRFLKLAGATVGGVVLACGGLGFWATRAPEIEFIESNCGGDKVSKKILVAYASKCGSTGEVAAEIGKTLCAKGAQAEVLPIGSVASLEGYGAVVLGSCVRIGAWLPEAKDFVKAHQAELNKLPTALFTVHMLAVDGSADSQAKRAAYTAPLRSLLTFKAEAFFAGKIDPARMSFLDRLATKVVKAPVADQRDWAKIRAWAQSLAL
jgi:menaquinone-dependent protoporphyrinogen oxidase